MGVSGGTRRLGIAALVLATLTIGTEARAITLTFDELPFQPVDGLSFSGVTFGFTVGGLPCSDAYYNSGGPGQGFWVQDPSLEGNAAGILTIDFAVPTPSLWFGVALSDWIPFIPGFVVDLFDPALNPIATIPVNTAVVPGFQFSEGQFVYASALVRRAVITFDPSPGRFALDNLTFIPEPTSWAILGLGIAGLGLLRRARSSQ